MNIDWNAEKNAVLRARYGIGFERVVVALADGDLVDERVHPNAGKYPNQCQYLVLIENYVWIVPFVREPDGVFFETMFPSRKATRRLKRVKS